MLIIFVTINNPNAGGWLLNNWLGKVDKSHLTDNHLTKKLKEAGRLLEIQVLDHIILTTEGYYSFADEGQTYRCGDKHINNNTLELDVSTYVETLRSQLSTFELVIIHYYCKMDESHLNNIQEANKKLMNAHNILQHLQPDKLFETK